MVSLCLKIFIPVVGAVILQIQIKHKQSQKKGYGK